MPFWLDDERLEAHCSVERVGPELRAMRVWGGLQVHLVNVPQRVLELVTRRLIEDEPARYRHDAGVMSFRGMARLVEVKPLVVRSSGDEDAFEVNARFLILGTPVLEEIPYARPARPRRDSLEEIPDPGPACPRRDSIIKSTRLWRAAEKSWAQNVEI
jgi:hypothetical protein